MNTSSHSKQHPDSSQFTLPSQVVESTPAKIKRITFLGTSSAVPQPGRCNVSSLNVFLTSGSSILVDCGEATQHQLMLSKSVKMGKIDVILITHLHGDHFFGIFGLLASLGTLSRTTPLTVVGPKGLKAAIDAVFLCEQQEATIDDKGEPGEQHPAPYTTKIIELEGEEPITLGSAGRGANPDHPHCLATDIGVDIMAIPIAHRVPTFGYRIIERHRAGTLNIQKARQLGVPNSQLGALKNGNDITLGDGTLVLSHDVVGEPIPGKSLCVVQDTHDPWRYRHLFDGCDVMIHECTYDDSMKEKAIAFGHSTPSMAAAFADATKTKHLILTHFSSRYDRDIVRFHAPTQSNMFFSTHSHQQPSPSDATVAVKHDCSGMDDDNDEDVSHAAPTQSLVATSVADLKLETESALRKLWEGSRPNESSAYPQVFVASDFRVFELDKHGSLIQLDEPDVNLSPLVEL